MLDDILTKLSLKLGELLTNKHMMCVTAESCTGGLVAKLITDIPGSSGWFDRGFVTYTNESKTQMLRVPSKTISSHGAVSEETVLAMALGALKQGSGQLAVSVSGVAGPTGGSPDKPVGTVWIAWALKNGAEAAQKFCFDGDRQAVRAQAAREALSGMIRILESEC